MDRSSSPRKTARRKGRKDSNTVARQNASAWNRGGFEQYRKGDAAREKAMPVGTVLPRAPLNK